MPNNNSNHSQNAEVSTVPEETEETNRVVPRPEEVKNLTDITYREFETNDPVLPDQRYITLDNGGIMVYSYYGLLDVDFNFGDRMEQNQDVEEYQDYVEAFVVDHMERKYQEKFELVPQPARVMKQRGEGSYDFAGETRVVSSDGIEIDIDFITRLEEDGNLAIATKDWYVDRLMFDIEWENMEKIVRKHTEAYNPSVDFRISSGIFDTGSHFPPQNYGSGFSYEEINQYFIDGNVRGIYGGIQMRLTIEGNYKYSENTEPALNEMIVEVVSDFIGSEYTGHFALRNFTDEDWALWKKYNFDRDEVWEAGYKRPSSTIVGIVYYGKNPDLKTEQLLDNREYVLSWDTLRR